MDDVEMLKIEVASLKRELSNNLLITKKLIDALKPLVLDYDDWKQGRVKDCVDDGVSCGVMYR